MTLNRNSMMNWWWLLPQPTLPHSPIGQPGDPPPPMARFTNDPHWWRGHKLTLLTLERLKRCRKKGYLTEKQQRPVLNEDTPDYVRSCRSHCYSTDWQTGATDFTNILFFRLCLSVCSSFPFFCPSLFPKWTSAFKCSESVETYLTCPLSIPLLLLFVLSSFPPSW